MTLSLSSLEGGFISVALPEEKLYSGMEFSFEILALSTTLS